MKHRNIIIFITALAFLIAAIFFASDNLLSPYVPFKEAVSSPGRYVQIIGRLDKNAAIVHGEGMYSFTAIDKEGTRLKVTHRGSKPQNFEHTEQAVMLGKYNATGNVFEAEKVLVKCPSKYRRKV